MDEDFIVDPGTYCYTGDPEARKKFRGTRMHNTVMIDGQEMNRFRKTTLFGMRNDAIPAIHSFESDAEHDLLAASHSGYRRLKHPVTHGREFFLDKKKGTVTITDTFEGSGEHIAEWNFHFASGVALQKKDGRFFAEKNGRKLEIVPTTEVMPHIKILIDEISPRYGIKEQAPVLNVRIPISLSRRESFRWRFQIAP
ncbi:heparinase II/III-family protein [Candidatus Peregrinibacteria bacterium]|nr:heparinase II/III-family protein [Candidatus Peregrinibacteria bacterium]